MKREYVSSVSLIVLGKSLDPDLVSDILQLAPNQSWSRGDLKKAEALNFKGKHTYGGWKKQLPDSYSKRSIESQLGYWVRALSKKAKHLKKLRMAQNVVYLDLIVTTDETATIIWSDEIIHGLSNLGIELKFNFMAP